MLKKTLSRLCFFLKIQIYVQSVKGFRGDFVAYQEVRDYFSNFLQLQNVFNNILAIATVQTNWYNNENKKLRCC